MAKLVRTKPYRVALTIAPSKARQDRGEGGLRELTAFMLAAPEDSPLRSCAVESDHRADFPRLRVTCNKSGRFTLQFYVKADVDTDAFVEELYAIFAKNDWEHL
ncbi:MAG TPA: hypothetical protein VGB13_04680 [Candidatus Krumholzibacteria bacterium]